MWGNLSEHDGWHMSLSPCLAFLPYHLLSWSSNHHYPNSTHFIFQYNLTPFHETLLPFLVQIRCSSLVTWKVMLILFVKYENTLQPFPNPYTYPKHVSKLLIPPYLTKTFSYLVQVVSNPSFSIDGRAFTMGSLYLAFLYKFNTTHEKTHLTSSLLYFYI